MAPTSASLLPSMSTDHSNTTTKPPETVFCAPFPNAFFELSDGGSVPYFVSGSLNAALAVVTTFANVVVLLAMRHVSSIRLPSKLLLCSLVLTDLGAGLLAIPQHAAVVFTKGSNPGLGICSLTYSSVFSASLFGSASLLTLTAISLDRYAALFFHLKYQQIVTARRVCAVLAFIWLVSLFFASAVLWNFSLWLIIPMLGIIIAFCVISVAYIKIFHRLRSQQVQPHDQAQQQAGNSPNTERYRRTASAMMWVYVLFVICYLPYLCLSVVLALRSSGLARFIHGVTYTVVLLNSCLNPFVYCLRLPEVRTEVIKQLRKFCCRNSQ